MTAITTTPVEAFCLFCHPASPTPAGSLEHVFLSAIGGRVTTTHALCEACNNAFSPWDEEIANLCLHARNALHIWSGRRHPPPTIKSAHEDPDHPGAFYDLGPGMVPLPQPMKIPSKDVMTVGSRHELVAKDKQDVARLLDVMKKRGLGITGRAKSVSKQLQAFNLPIKMQITEGFKSIAKLAFVSANVQFGNKTTLEKLSRKNRSAARDPHATVHDFVAFGYGLDWVALQNKRAHPRTPQAIASDFDHSVVLADVGGKWVGFVELFGGYRFIVILGEESGLPPAALIVNPTSLVCSKLEADITPPLSFTFPTGEPDTALAVKGVAANTQRALEVCYAQGREQQAEQYAEELLGLLKEAGTDELKREEAVSRWSQKMITLKSGKPWQMPMDLSLD